MYIHSVYCLCYYSLHILDKPTDQSWILLLKCLTCLLTVSVCSVDSVKSETVTCKEGKSPVLHSYHEIKKGVQIQWRRVSAKVSAIASMSENDKKTYWYEPRFRGRLQLDPQTGSLIIRNLRKTDAGVYFLEIKSKGGTAYRKYEVILTGK